MGKDIQGGILKWIMRISYYEKPCRFSYKMRLKDKLRFPQVLIWKILSAWKNQDAEQYIEDNSIIYTYIYISIYMFLSLDIHPSIYLFLCLWKKYLRGMALGNEKDFYFPLKVVWDFFFCFFALFYFIL